MKPTIGVLGGLGPATTAEFYLEVIRRATTYSRPPMCIWSVPLRLDKEREFIISGLHAEYLYLHLKKGAQALERAGSEHMVIPCNTVHEFHSRLSQEVSVPVVNLIDLVAEEVRKRQWRELFLLATSRTIKTRLYQTVLAKSGIAVHTPTAQEQIHVDDLITGLLGESSKPEHTSFLESLVGNAGANHILLGCTDLQLVFASSEDTIDSMAVLAQHTADLCFA